MNLAELIIAFILRNSKINKYFYKRIQIQNLFFNDNNIRNLLEAIYTVINAIILKKSKYLTYH